MINISDSNRVVINQQESDRICIENCKHVIVNGKDCGEVVSFDGTVKELLELVHGKSWLS